MEVLLYVYDLSKGLARVWSLPLTGIQIDAIYHTSLVLGNTEYFFGDGVKRKVAGTTHHGQPVEVMKLGQTELPTEVIHEYIDSLEQVYTQESYDLFLHNCNNFTQDLAMFLLGRGIPDHIRTLPERFLQTPFGQMMKPAVDATIRRIASADAGGADVPRPTPLQNGHIPGPSHAATSAANGGLSSLNSKSGARTSVVHSVTKLQEIEDLLNSAKESCAVLFFTSSTCAPCKIVYPAYDELAAEAGSKAVLIKVDLDYAEDINLKYQVRATPTFMTFLKGEKENEWAGANERQLRGNVQLLIQMAWPLHPHRKLRLPSIEGKITQIILYKNLPPFDKMVTKLGTAAGDSSVQGLVHFVKTRKAEGAAAARLPDLKAFSSFVQSSFRTLPAGAQFALTDLVRVAFIDARVSGYFAEEKDHATILTILTAKDVIDVSYNQRLVMLQLACNLFTSPLYPEHIISSDALREALMKLVSSSMLDSHNNIRFLASAFAYNLAAYNHNERIEDRPDRLSEDDQVELAACILEALKNENESLDSLHGLLFALGLLVYCAPMDGEVVDLCRAAGAGDVVGEKRQVEAFAKEPLLKEVGQELLAKGVEHHT